MPDRLHRILINASPERVYAALTEQEGLAGWWTKETNAMPKIGAVLQFRFGEKGFNDMKVLELTPNKRFKWQLCGWGQGMDRNGVDLRLETKE